MIGGAVKVNNISIACAAVLTLLSTGTCFAAYPLVCDDAETLGKGAVQVEFNAQISYDNETTNGSTTKTDGTQLSAAISAGLSDKLDLIFGITRPWGSGDSDGASFNDAGSTDFALYLKWQLYKQEGFSIAVRPQLGYSYSVGTDNDYTMSYGATLVLTKELGPIAFHLNAGYTFNDHNRAEVRDACRDSIWNFSLATTYQITEELKLGADFGTATYEDKSSSEMPVFGLGGLIYTVNNNLDLSAGLKLGLTKPEDDLTGCFGVTLKY